MFMILRICIKVMVEVVPNGLFVLVMSNYLQ